MTREICRRVLVNCNATTCGRCAWVVGDWCAFFRVQVERSPKGGRVRLDVCRKSEVRRK